MNSGISDGTFIQFGQFAYWVLLSLLKKGCGIPEYLMGDDGFRGQSYVEDHIPGSGQLFQHSVSGELLRRTLDKMDPTVLFNGKVAVVTGSSAGIGEATALLLAKRGAKLTLHGRDLAKLGVVAKKVEDASGTKPHLVIGNIEDDEVREKLINETVEKFGRLDILVNNAGYLRTGGWQKADLKNLRDMLECHVVAPYHLCRLAMPELLKNKGNIVMVSSVAGMRGLGDYPSYCAAKAAMDNLMRSLSTEVAKESVRVNCVNPGAVGTEIGRYEEVQEARRNRNWAPDRPMHPNHRNGTSIEVAQVIAFLASDAASMVTGIIHPVDGGLTAAGFFD